MIETVTGAIADDELGTTLMHEHVFGLSAEIHWNWPDLPEDWDLDRRVREAADTLDEIKALGVDTIVDLTVIGLGRYVPAVAAVAALTDVRIIVSTGIYTYDALPPYFANRGPGSMFGGSDRMAEFFVRDITEGIGRTGVRAGMLKCAVDRPGVTPGIARLLTAIASAHHDTGAPITVHTDSDSRRGLDAQRELRDRGVDLERVVIGHAGDSTDLDYLRALADAGSWLGMDRFGVEFTSFEDRVATVVALCESGYAERMVLSHDAYCFNDRVDPGIVAQRHPNYRYPHIPTDVLPELRRRGVSDEQITTMMVGNPRAILASR
ncbi:phosphotriesterase family protein [Streptomyces spiralis]|uniref:phosphotriesterase family protein n=1 Tax=Streptomyces spiralis TaxID=66376 RepID=UPI0033C6821B